MTINWSAVIFDSLSPQAAWTNILAALLELSRSSQSPDALHDATVVPDRLLAEAAWELWETFPEQADGTAANLKQWTANGSGKAVLILDALSLRELPILLNAAQARDIHPTEVKLTGAGCPTTTEHFARNLGLPSRSTLANNTKSGTFSLFDGKCATDVYNLPFEDCPVPPSPNLVIWHSWLDDHIHVHKRNPKQIANLAATTLSSDGFWGFINRLRQGRILVVTSDHGYAVSSLFSSEIRDPEAIDTLRSTFGASRNTAAKEPWPQRFMPPIVMTHANQHVVVGQRKWRVQGGFPAVCHGGMTLLEAVVPWVEFPAL